jgi:hypothetical protein
VRPQETDKDELVHSKFKLLQKYTDENNSLMIVKTILEILDYDPQNIIASKQLKWCVRVYFNQISEDSELLENVILKIKNDCDLPILDLAFYYYNNRNNDKARQYLMSIAECDYHYKKNNINSILESNNRINPTLYNDLILYSVKSVDTLFKPIFMYLYYQCSVQNGLQIGNIFELFNFDKEYLRIYFNLEKTDSLQLQLNNHCPNYSYITFQSFTKLIFSDDSLPNIPNKTSDLTISDLINAYKTNDIDKIKSSIEKLMDKTSINISKATLSDLSEFLDAPIRNYFFDIIGIILEKLDLSDVKKKYSPFEIYNVIKKLYALNLTEGSINLFRTMDYVVTTENDPLSFIPLLFSKYFLKDTTAFKEISKKFFFVADKKNVQLLSDELAFWSKLKVEINYLKKLIRIYNSEDEENYIPSTTNNESENYYALLIGIQDYEFDLFDLKYPEEDVKKFQEILTNYYTFQAQNIITLINPNRKDIIRAFTELKKLDNEDNLLIFYAGHGNWDEVAQQGYWLPVDAKPNDLSSVLTNSEITSFIKAIKNKHTLLISDACFSGSIFKTRDAFFEKQMDISYYQSKKARKAITSGALTPVPDKSIFVEFLLKTLEQNSNKYITAEELFLKFREAVTNNSPTNQRPLFGQINNSGDEGGDFVFIRK